MLPKCQYYSKIISETVNNSFILVEKRNICAIICFECGIIENGMFEMIGIKKLYMQMLAESHLQLLEFTKII
jgi:hypothetical protein